MHIFKTVADIQHWLDGERRNGKTVGLSPTMGALHTGHLSLVHASKKECDLAVVSIFVNPTQFNESSDLEKYPRMPEKDIALLLSANCDVVFMPPVEEVYPPGQDVTVRLDFGQLEKSMEGEFRPGHFGGMATVVNRLVDIVLPNRLYMGQKDYQQQAIVRNMLQQFNSPTQLVMCPTAREADGLAMSSRNLRLTPEMRAVAPIIQQTMLEAKTAFQTQPAALVQANALKQLEAAGLRPEYFDIVDGISLLPVAQYADSAYCVVCTAAWAGDVRLIDNMVLKEAAQ